MTLSPCQYFKPLFMSRQRIKHPQARFYQSFLNPSKVNEGVVITHLPRPDRSHYLAMMDDEFIRENPHLCEDVLQSRLYPADGESQVITEQVVKEKEYQQQQQKEEKDEKEERKREKTMNVSEMQKHKKRVRISPTDFMNVDKPLHYEQPTSNHSTTFSLTPSTIPSYTNRSINDNDNDKESDRNSSTLTNSDISVLSNLQSTKHVGNIYKE